MLEARRKWYGSDSDQHYTAGKRGPYSADGSVRHAYLWKFYLSLQDLSFKPKYLVTYTVGYEQKKNIVAAVKK
ncbi:hypothetical protein SESBI_40862, partial [Sesbania bispinosa]